MTDTIIAVLCALVIASAVAGLLMYWHQEKLLAQAADREIRQQRGLDQINSRLARARIRADDYAVRAETAEADRATLEEANDMLRERVIALTPPDKVTLTKQQIDDLNANRCVYCGGAHAITCPRVRRIKFKADGATPDEVEYWLDWPQDRVTFFEDIVATDEEPVTAV